jgi:hypothetical protein
VIILSFQLFKELFLYTKLIFTIFEVPLWGWGAFNSLGGFPLVEAF